MEGIGKGLIGGIIILCLVSLILGLGGWAVIDWLVTDNSIRSTVPIEPRIELVIKDNQVDTLYVYEIE